MAELAVASALCGIVSLAEVVVTKGYKYVKAVKNCREDVKQLFVEVNIFCGVLNRLSVLVSEELEETDEDDDSDDDDDNDEDENEDSENANGGISLLNHGESPSLCCASFTYL